METSSVIPSTLVRVARRLTEPFVWTHPSILATFRCRPAYQASFKKTWLALLWGGEVETRRLREAIAVAVSVANRCSY